MNLFYASPEDGGEGRGGGATIDDKLFISGALLDVWANCCVRVQ